MPIKRTGKSLINSEEAEKEIPMKSNAVVNHLIAESEYQAVLWRDF
jgi:hypothetical protein